MLSVLIPASNEEAYVGPCLEALLAQHADAALDATGVEIIIAANGCSDATAAVARRCADRFAARGWRLAVLDIPEGGKTNALNHAEAAATFGIRVFLDADVICGPDLLAKLRAALDIEAPRYATGRLVVARASSWITRRYADVWTRLPFVEGGAVGAGLFAVNAAGRARWGDFPDIISDDTFVRLHFTPAERIEVDAPYTWPMVEGFAALTRVRRRQDAGVAELYRLHPELRANEGKSRPGAARLARIAAASPLGAIVYATVSVAVRLGGGDAAHWARGRGAAPGPVAHLTGEFPKVSHTFILREVQGLRRHGLDVLTCSIRRTPTAELLGPDEQDAAARTFHVLEAARRPLRLAGDHGGMLLRAPASWFGALALALRTAPPGARGLVYQLFYFAEAGVLAAELRQRRARRLHNHFADSSCTVAMLAAHMAAIPFSFTMHGPTEFFAAERWRLDEKIARADRVICISHFCRSQLMIFVRPEHWPKISIVRCGVVPACYGRAADAPDGAHVICVGRLAAVKGTPILLEAMATLRQSHPAARLTLIGDGPERADLEARAEALGIGDVVTFAGARPQAAVAEALSRADVFVLPSFAEGLPVVLMEAMASSLPVVTTRIAGVPELVLDGFNGFTVPPGDSRSLADRISTLLDDPALRRRMGRSGREKIEAEFDIDAETARLAELLAITG